MENYAELRRQRGAINDRNCCKRYCMAFNVIFIQSVIWQQFIPLNPLVQSSGYVSINSKLQHPHEQPLRIWTFNDCFFSHSPFPPPPPQTRTKKCVKMPHSCSENARESELFTLNTSIFKDITLVFWFKISQSSQIRFKFSTSWSRTTVKCVWVGWQGMLKLRSTGALI